VNTVGERNHTRFGLSADVVFIPQLKNGVANSMGKSHEGLVLAFP
jgi:hypothetical protein